MENKIATTLEQSKKLLELGIDISTANMHYCNNALNKNNYRLGLVPVEEAIELLDDYCPNIKEKLSIVPAWSCSALLDILPAGIKNYTLHIIKDNVTKGYFCSYRNKKNEVFVSTSGFNVIDAVFEMIVYLKENKLL